MSVSQTHSLPFDGPDDDAGNVCSNSNTYFVLYIVGSLVCLMFVLYCRYREVAPRVMLVPPQQRKTPDFGIPFKLAVHVYSVAMWMLLPSVVFYLLFHVLSTDTFSLQSSCACVLITSLPIIAIIVFLKATSGLLRSTWPTTIRRDVCDVLLPPAPLLTDNRTNSADIEMAAAVKQITFTRGNEPTDAVTGSGRWRMPEKVLVLGCTSHGAVLVDALDKERRGVS
ncbi:membrane-associated protein, putative [Bodo saltans]|uniref:Membrane-associated protein, putative n=1 Tax=Bodo saltans TaxID=75058 RepID=A0A0S4JMP7_BODSA|nr:membrane-associated protein, putative [Bodo saltans]|eukprot:CUG92771.1 membrane-associated protein, putative [Bodo saltans]